MTLRDKWFQEYIYNIDLSKISWIKLNAEEFKTFILENYYDLKEQEYVYDEYLNLDSPFGLYYLTFTNINKKWLYILGTVNNNIGKKTIVACTIYSDSFYLFNEPINSMTSILSMETNFYFRNKGIYTKMCNEIVNFISKNQSVIVSEESKLGKMYHTFDILKNSLIKNGFSSSIFIDEFSHIDSSELKELIRNRKK